MVRNLPSGRYVLIEIVSFLTVNFVFHVPVDSSVIEEQLTRPRREKSATSKNGPSKCWKIFPLWNGRFEEGGWGLKKKRPLAVLRDKSGNGRCPLVGQPYAWSSRYSFGYLP